MEVDWCQERMAEVEKNGRTKPDRAKPDRTKPGRAKPDRTNPDRTKPHKTKPSTTKPYRTKPDRTKLDRTKPYRTKPNRIKARQDKTLQKKTQQDKIWQVQTRQDKTQQDQRLLHYRQLLGNEKIQLVGVAKHVPLLIVGNESTVWTSPSSADQTKGGVNASKEFVKTNLICLVCQRTQWTLEKLKIYRICK